jgi:two-component system, OmpR family, sensor histidine kinase YxdK
MKLFLRDHASLLLLNVLQLSLILLICWLAGFHNLDLLLYAVLLCALTLMGYLLYRYFTRFIFYRRLSSALASLDESLVKYGSSPLGEALTDLLHTQYRFYQERLFHYQRSQEMHTTFTNIWVHQMKTPLSVISLITQDEDDPRFMSIREETDRLQQGLEMTLYTARLDTFASDFHVEPVALHTITNEVIRKNKQFFLRNAVYPEVQIDSTLLVLSDLKWLAFIIDQLVINAIKYSSGNRKKVRLVAQVQGDRATLTVSDQGVGIPAADLPRIFEPYFTGENGRTHRQSTGMGLYLVHEACKQLEHSITVESAVNTGTTFHLTFFSRTPSGIGYES